MIDITPIWNRCHSHLRPLAEHLPIQNKNSAEHVVVAAHVRVGENDWLDEPTEIHYSWPEDRFLVDPAALPNGSKPRLEITAVNARLWFDEPTFLNLEPTTRCNFNCWYCVGRHMKQEDIDPSQLDAVLDHFPALETLALVGEGEPLMHKQFFAMAKKAADRGIKVMIISNGSTLSESNVRKLCESGVYYIGISIDSIDPKTFASSRIDGKLEQVWKGIERLRKYRDANGYAYPKIGLKGTLFEGTEHHLPEIIEHAASHGVEIYESFQALNPMDSYVSIYPASQISELKHVDRINTRIQQDAAAQNQLKPLSVFCDEAGIDFDKNGRPNPLRNNCDEQWIYTLLSGDVTPCCQVKTPISDTWNLFKNPLEKIMSDPLYENTRFNLWNGIFPNYCSNCWKTR